MRLFTTSASCCPTHSYHLFAVTDQDLLIRKILLERRKELLVRTVRWTDWRKLNEEPSFEITLSRVINNKIYSLAPYSEENRSFL